MAIFENIDIDIGIDRDILSEGAYSRPLNSYVCSVYYTLYWMALFWQKYVFIPPICLRAIKRRGASCQSGCQSVKVAIFLPLHTAPFNALHKQQQILPMNIHQQCI